MAGLVLTLAASSLLGCRAGTGTPDPVSQTPASPSPGLTPTDSSQPGGVPWFEDVAAASGVTVRNLSGTPAKPFIVESMGSGGCWLDYDRDGWLDLFVVQGSTFAEHRPQPAPGDVLYRNLGDGTFADTTSVAGIREQAWGGGCAVGDVDNDGWPDLYVLNHGPNVLWRNRGDGSFEDWTRVAGVGDPRWGVSGAFADFDGDGDLDLYAVNYVAYDWDNPLVDGGKNFCLWHGLQVFCGPRGLIRNFPVYYENRGDGSFSDATRRAGIEAAGPTFGLGVALLDFDRDGDLDIYTANDARPNHLWRNHGDGTFEEIGFSVSAGLSDRGKEQAGMGVDAGDYDNDGWFDIFVTNFSEDTYSLYQNEQGLFADVALATGVTQATFVPLGWGTKFFDFDLDGDLDILAVNGHVYPHASQFDADPPFTWRQRPNLLENRAGRFVDIAAQAGPGMARELAGRGGAVADYDNDGDPDVLIVNIDAEPSLLRSQGVPRNHWLGVELQGRVSNRDGIGAIVVATAAGLPSQRRQAVPSGSYCSSSDPRVLIGLGSAVRVDLEVEWPSGLKTALPHLEVDRYVVVIEGESRPAGGDPTP